MSRRKREPMVDMRTYSLNRAIAEMHGAAAQISVAVSEGLPEEFGDRALQLYRDLLAYREEHPATYAS